MTPTYDVDVGGVSYEVDAPDPNTAWLWANQTHEQGQTTQEQPQPEKLGLLQSIGESITGARRETETTRTLPEWTGMPELNQFSMKSFLSALGTMAAGPDEIAQILKSNFPEMGVRQDEKGNYVFRSTVDNQEYAVPPGFSVGDIPRAAGTVLAFTPAGRATSLVGAAGAAGATQGAIEATQAISGGEFSAGETALATALGPVGPVVARGAGAARQLLSDPAKRAVQGAFGAPAPEQAAARAVENVPSPTLPQQTAEQFLESAPASVLDTPKVAQALPDQAQKDIGTLVKNAARGSDSAKRELAQLAGTNADATAAAERLGLDLPVDVLSDSDAVRQAAAIPRNLAFSEAESQWQRTLVDAANKSDEALAAFDAIPDTSAVSQKVLDSLKATREQLKASAQSGYEQVDAAVPKSTKVQLTNVKQLLDETLVDLGGDTSRLKAVERELLKDAESETLTYEGLRRIKNEVFEALNGKENEYSKNLTVGIIKRLYGAVAEDQLDNVGRIAGEEVRKQLRAANFATARQKALEKRVMSAFGREAEGSMVALLNRAVSGGSKTGDITALKKVLNTAPEELHREVIGSAVAAATRAKSGALKGQFGFSEYADFYRGMRRNSEVFKTVSKALGPDAMATMRDLFEVSARITEARARVLTTGKANQALKDAMSAEGLVANVLNSSLGRKVTQASAAGVGATVAGPLAATGAAALVESLAQGLSKGGKESLEAAGKLFSSQEFKNLAIKAASGQKVTKGDTFKLSTSKAFRRFADAARLPKERGAREKWIMQSLLAGQNVEQPDEVTE